MLKRENTPKKKLREVFRLTMLALGVVFAQGIVTGAAAYDPDPIHFSRACTALGINESGTWKGFKPLNGWYWVNSHHHYFDRNTRKWVISAHVVKSGWNRFNRAYQGGWSSIRAVAQHTGEWWLSPAVTGYHYKYFTEDGTIQRLDQTFTRTCIDPPLY